MGVNDDYIKNVAMKEIYNLVRVGFSLKDLQDLSLAKRRYYFHLLIEENRARQKAIDEANSAR